jgi:hypothetical protein
MKQVFQNGTDFIAFKLGRDVHVNLFIFTRFSSNLHADSVRKVNQSARMLAIDMEDISSMSKTFLYSDEESLDPSHSKKQVPAPLSYRDASTKRF